MDNAQDRPPSRPVRVAHLLGRLGRGGGVQVVVRQLARNVDQGAVELHLVSLRPMIASDHVDEVPIEFHGIAPETDPFNPGSRPKASLAVLRTLRNISPDVVQVHSGVAWLGVLASVFIRAPFVFESHDAPGSGRHSRVTDFLEGIWVRLRRVHVVCHSASVSREVERRWRVPQERVVTFPLAAEVASLPAGYDRPAVRERLGINDTDVVLVAVGRFVPSKQFDVALRVLKQLRDRGLSVKLVLIGSGPEHDRLNELHDSLGVSPHVIMPGPLFDEDLASALHTCDILISSSAYEGFGLTLVEGMRAGLPVVATAVGGVTDIVLDGKTGFLVEDGDLESLVTAVGRLVENQELRQQFAKCGQARADALYTPIALAKNFTNLYQRIAQPRSNRWRWPANDRTPG